jgi:RHS repeat-associated protein
MAGNMRFGYERVLDQWGPFFEEYYAHSHQSAYGLDEKLRFYEQFGRVRPTSENPDPPATENADDLWQEFRYDALGRRVLVRSVHRPFCDAPEQQCSHTIERFIWDGDQLLYELRAPGDTSDNLEAPDGTGRQYGRVAYVHARGLDAPLGVVRQNYEGWKPTFLLVPHSDWRGQWEMGTQPDGTKYPDCTPSDPYCIWITWPSTAVRSYYHLPARRNAGDWVGSILRDQRDPSGFLYRRNRYYDPFAGRFTQPDPIGLAGGLNLYGFAAGDPVNFADPFGLCPICVAVYVAFEVASGIYDAYATYRAFQDSPSEGAEALEASIIGAMAPGPGNLYRQAGKFLSRLLGRGGKSVAGLPKEAAQLRHIFRDAAGHLPDTPANRELLEVVANDQSAKLGTDKFGNVWSARILDDGSQVWVQTRNGTIQNGGVNATPRIFHPESGLSGGG